MTGRLIHLVGVARTLDELTRGLMFVHALPPDSGLLFVFPEPEVLEFWMRHTPLPLDIAFVDESGQVVRTAAMQPFSHRRTSSGVPCLKALEVEQGTFARLGIRAGQRMTVAADDSHVTFTDI